MFKIAVIIFREFIEIAILLGVILAVTKDIQRSRIYIIFGSMIGIVAASIFAFSAKSLSNLSGGVGDEIFDSLIVLLTCVLIGWTVVWMQGYDKKLTRDLNHISEKINAGTGSNVMLVFLVAMTVLREATEIILFIYSISSAEGIDVDNYLLGIGIGALGGLLTGSLIYSGLMKYSGKYIFKISSLLLIFIAASLASQAAGILTSSGIIESFTDQVWDSSWLISDKSFTGIFLNVVLGYESKPNKMQLIFYFSTIVLIIILSKIRKKFCYISKKSNI